MTILDVGDDGVRAPDGRPLTRAEIDDLVRETIRLEQDLDQLHDEPLEHLLARTPYRPATPHGGHAATPPRPRRRWRWLLLGAVSAVLLVGVVLRAGGAGLVDAPATAPHRYSDGHYAFLRMQPDGRDLPVGYNPCHRLPIWVNYANATPDVEQRVREAVREINAASGMHLAFAGATQLRPRDASQRGGVVIAFANAGTDGGMAGDVVGRGGSASYPDPTPGSTTYYVGGGITLDTDQFNPASGSMQRAILLHEIGHTLGLAHAKGSTEIMNPAVNAASHYQHGDLTGLAVLGSLPCR